MTTKAEKVKAYNELYPKYNITGIKKMTEAEIENRIKWGARSLDEAYKSYSDAKEASYKEILRTYRPNILAVAGNSQTYTVLLMAENGDMLHITRDNNYLVERI